MQSKLHGDQRINGVKVILMDGSHINSDGRCKINSFQKPQISRRVC